MPQRTLVFAIRVEPPSVASKPLRVSGQGIGNAVRLFNAELDYVDEQGVTHPYLEEDLPRLATDTWRTFPDGRMETTYHLRPNLTWHNGDPLTADDFAFAFHVYSTAELGAGMVLRGAVQEVVAADLQTVVIRWKQLHADADTIGTGLPALPSQLLGPSFQQGTPDAFVGHPFWSTGYVGLGPYRLDHWEPGSFIEGSAFGGHVLGAPKIDRVKVRFIGDPNVVVANLLAEEVHVATDISLGSAHGFLVEREWAPRNERSDERSGIGFQPPSLQLGAGRSNGGTVIFRASGFRETEIQLRPEFQKSPELSDVRVRRALLLSLDRNQLNDALMGGKGLVSDSPLSSREVWYPSIASRVRTYAYDTHQAELMLTEAGLAKDADGLFAHPNGERFSPEIWAITGGDNDAELQIMIDGYRRFGIDATPKILPTAFLTAGPERSKFPALSMSGNAGETALIALRSAAPGPSNQFLGGGGRGGWSNPEFDRFVDALAGTLDRSERTRLDGELARVYSEELPHLPLYYVVRITAYVGALRGPVVPLTPNAGPESIYVYNWEWSAA